MRSPWTVSLKENSPVWVTVNNYGAPQWVRGQFISFSGNYNKIRLDSGEVIRVHDHDVRSVHFMNKGMS